MELATLASGSVIFALNNPAGSGKNLIMKRMSAKVGFVGTPAATRVPIAINRATGTAAAGTGSKATSAIPKRSVGGADSVASLFYGPAAITGLTDVGTEGLIKSTVISHQVGTPLWDELIEDVKNIQETDCLLIVPGTSLVARTAAISIAGSGISFDAEWCEQ